MEHEYSKKEGSFSKKNAIPIEYGSNVLAKYCGEKQVNSYIYFF